LLHQAKRGACEAEKGEGGANADAGADEGDQGGGLAEARTANRRRVEVGQPEGERCDEASAQGQGVLAYAYGPGRLGVVKRS
jgi:hypothetical protein